MQTSWHMLILASCLVPFASVVAFSPALQQLGQRLEALRTQIDALNQHMKVEDKKQQATLLQTQQLTRQSLALSRWPLPLAAITSMASERGDAAQLIAHLRRQTTLALAQQQTRLAGLLELRQEAEAKAGQLAELQGQYLRAAGKLSPAEQLALVGASHDAHTMLLNIQSALTQPLPPVGSPVTRAEELAAAAAGKARVLLPLSARPIATTTGLLFQGKAGAVVSSAGTGQVLYAGPFRKFGGLVILQTGPRTQHIYAGMGELDVRAGQMVEAGQALGRLPEQAPTNLYWEIRKNGAPVTAARILAGSF